MDGSLSSDPDLFQGGDIALRSDVLGRLTILEPNHFPHPTVDTLISATNAQWTWNFHAAVLTSNGSKPFVRKRQVQLLWCGSSTCLRGLESLAKFISLSTFQPAFWLSTAKVYMQLRFCIILPILHMKSWIFKNCSRHIAQRWGWVQMSGEVCMGMWWWHVGHGTHWWYATEEGPWRCAGREHLRLVGLKHELVQFSNTHPRGRISEYLFLGSCNLNSINIQGHCQT